MADDELRAAERRWRAEGSEDAASAYLRALGRAGKLPDIVELSGRIARLEQAIVTGTFNTAAIKPSEALRWILHERSPAAEPPPEPLRAGDIVDARWPGEDAPSMLRVVLDQGADVRGHGISWATPSATDEPLVAVRRTGSTTGHVTPAVIPVSDVRNVARGSGAEREHEIQRLIDGPSGPLRDAALRLPRIPEHRRRRR